jgi:hypothetical protein
MSKPGDSVDPVVDPVDADPVVVHGCMAAWMSMVQGCHAGSPRDLGLRFPKPHEGPAGDTDTIDKGRIPAMNFDMQKNNFIS